MLIYVPDGARPAIGAIVCIIAVANLNYFHPHKTSVLFWLTQLTFISSSLKYITALMIESSSHDPDATEEDIETVGSILIAVEIFTFSSMFICLVAACWVLKQKLKKQDQRKLRMRHVLKTHVSMGSNAFHKTEKDESGNETKSNTKVTPALPLSNSVDKTPEDSSAKDDNDTDDPTTDDPTTDDPTTDD